MLKITKPIGPWKAFNVLADGKVVGTVRRKDRHQWLLTDKVGCSFESSFPLVRGLTSCKAFETEAEAVSFIKKYYN